MSKRRRNFLVVGIGGLAVLIFLWIRPHKKVDFNAEVRPIINTKCISCHGGVKESGGFSLFSREDALKPTKSGKPAIIPGDPDDSEFMKRLVHADPEERMPYHAEPLKPEEIEILRQWIADGANWQDHWAYLKPVKPEIPTIDTTWGNNVIDNFIYQKLKTVHLNPAPQADKTTLLRRLSLDLIGLPPTEKELAEFLADSAVNAYQKQVDRLLASPHFGERWAAMWLDLARYADSRGYEKDQPRNIWRYRDYVINSFNEDKPFDQFTIEQLAGDLLPNPTESQLIATAYHRNTTNNDEGGTDDEEFRTTSVIDRVNNTWEVWQGTTMGCVQCHSHPYDPVRHEEFYQSMAFFNNSRDEDVPDETPVLAQYKLADQEKINSLKKWISTHTSPSEKSNGLSEINQLFSIAEPKIHPHTFDTLTNAALMDGKFMGIGHTGFARVKNVDLTDKRHILLNAGFGSSDCRLEIRKDKLNGDVIAEATFENEKKPGAWSFRKMLIDLKPVNGKHTLYFIAYNPRTKNIQDYAASFRWIYFMNKIPGSDHADFVPIKDTLLAILNRSDIDYTPVMQENPANFKRKSFVFERGNWLTKGKEVQPITPKFLSSFASYSSDRLGLAKWLVSKDNSLTARVTVNRFWEQLFGTGIVETLEDFGSQGAKPSHPELLDYLAMSFQTDFHWSVKKLLQQIVMSATYQQSSGASKLLISKDPANRYLARGPRVRLSAEQVRDQALAVSGLLSKKMYGKSVMPPQPDGVWQVVYSGEQWKTSDGEDAFRRALYTFWRRSSPYPSLMTFDAAGREVCVSRRIRTNTPLQALVTLNDTVFISAARGLASQMQCSRGSISDQLLYGYKRALLKNGNTRIAKVLLKLYQNADLYYKKNPNEIAKILGRVPEKKRIMQTVGMNSSVDSDQRHLACLTIVANAIMNLDEFIMKE
ncbi:DUF1553 domain-containing protein [Xanthocytophaga agilis]|uniref:DUF1553 domain-containing protein n=1 Tax=Xanthocytophaga agilis TaxID=3048010 RepID=A0AAE3UG45_9BACT|nr:DUF1553 domain-containing protein [Xanthocytophaga agilis]MDJ1502936.1 DUF1553 domain-containing protein [Xanthocytophaga agilis]